MKVTLNEYDNEGHLVGNRSYRTKLGKISLVRGDNFLSEQEYQELSQLEGYQSAMKSGMITEQTSEPTEEPTLEPTEEPTLEPTLEPTEDEEPTEDGEYDEEEDDDTLEE